MDARLTRSAVSLLIAAIILTASAPAVKASDLWDFIKVGKSYLREPEWVVVNGKARVELKANEVEIEVFYADDLKDAADKLPYSRILIRGTVSADRIIHATGTFLGTDRNPIKLTGRFMTRSDRQQWGEKRKIVTFKEIVFSYPSNFEFFGFFGSDYRDE